MELQILIINTGHFIVINARVMSYTGMNLIFLTWWKYKTSMPICPLEYQTTSSFQNEYLIYWTMITLLMYSDTCRTHSRVRFKLIN